MIVKNIWTLDIINNRFEHQNVNNPEAQYLKAVKFVMSYMYSHNH